MHAPLIIHFHLQVHQALAIQLIAWWCAYLNNRGVTTSHKAPASPEVMTLQFLFQAMQVIRFVFIIEYTGTLASSMIWCPAQASPAWLWLQQVSSSKGPCKPCQTAGGCKVPCYCTGVRNLIKQAQPCSWIFQAADRCQSASPILEGINAGSMRMPEWDIHVNSHPAK